MRVTSPIWPGPARKATCCCCCSTATNRCSCSAKVRAARSSGFAERTPDVALDQLAPDIHVKSAQYRLEELPERYVVERQGGRILLAPHEPGRSTTDLLARVRSRA